MTDYRQWQEDYYDDLSTSYRVLHELMKNFKTMEEVEKFSFLYHQLPVWEYHMDILLFGSDKEKIKLFNEVKE